MTKQKEENYFFIYPRGKDGHPTGTTICVLTIEGKQFWGESLCSPVDQFNKKVGRELALKRAHEQHERAVNGVSKKDNKEETVIEYWKNKIFSYKITTIFNKEKIVKSVVISSSEKNSVWHEDFCTITDTGNNYLISNRNNQNITLGYFEACELALGLNIIAEINEFKKQD